MPASTQMIKELQNHNYDAFDIVYDEYHKLVFYVIYSIAKDVETTKELVQDTFLKMWNNIHSFQLNTNFKAWLLTIAKNSARDYLKTRKQHDLLEGDVISNQEHMSTFSEFNMDARQVLSDFEYNVITLTLIYNLKRREVADVLERPVGTISRVYSEAMHKLKKFYEYK